MKAKNIPNKESLDKLTALLQEAEPLAVELSKDETHGGSVHIGSIVGRVRGALESLEWHGKFLDAAPDPKPATKSTDAKAGAAPVAPANEN